MRWAINRGSMPATRSDHARAEPWRRTVPGRLFRIVKIASYIELGLFAGLLFVWLMPGFESETFAFGLAHGLGFIALALLVWAAVLRREAPYLLLAATLTPVGPVGSVIAIAWLENKEGRDREGGHAARP
jgi:hypothetical protein